MTNESIENWGRDQTTLTQWITVGLIVGLFFSAPLVNLFEALLIIAVLVAPTLRERFLMCFRSPFCILAILFFILVIVGATYSEAPPEDSWGMVSGWRKILVLLLGFAVVTSTRHKKLLIKTFLLVGTASLLWSFLSYHYPDWLYHRNAIGIIVKNHATQGIFFSICALLCLIWAKYFTAIPRTKYLLYALVVAFFFNLAMITIGRSGYLAALILITIFIFHTMRDRGRFKQLLATGIAALTIMIFFLIADTSKERIELAVNEFTSAKSVTEGDPGSMGVRYIWWGHSLNMISKNPIIGIGTGAFEYGLEQEIEGLTGPAAIRTNDPHNQYLKIWVEHGAIGLLIFLGLIYTMLTAKKIAAPFKLAGTAVLLSWCATSMANSHFSTFHEGHFIWFWMGAMLSPEK